MKITDLQLQKKRDTRYNVYVDGEFYAGLSDETVVRHGLFPGREVTPGELEAWRQESRDKFAFASAVDYVAKKRCSEREVFDNLTRKGYPPEAAAAAVAKLKDYGYLDDRAYALCYVDEKMSDRGELRLRAELSQKGVEERWIEEALSRPLDFAASAEGVLKKYLRGRPRTPAVKASAFRHLAGRGFDYDLIREALAPFFEDEED